MRCTAIHHELRLYSVQQDLISERVRKLWRPTACMHPIPVSFPLRGNRSETPVLLAA